MKAKLSTIVILLLCSANSVKAQSAQELWDRTFVSTVRNAPCISFDLTVDGIYYGEQFSRDTVCHVVSTADELWHKNRDRLKNLWISNEDFRFFNLKADDIVYGSVWKDSTHAKHSSEFDLLIYPIIAWGNIADYLPLYFLRSIYSSEELTPDAYRDTICGNTPYWVFMLTDNSLGLMDGETFVPNDDSIFFFVNKSSYLVDRMDLHSRNKLWAQYGHQDARCIFHNLKILDRVPTPGDEWNIESSRYKNTPKYDIKQHIPASLSNLRPPQQYKITDRQILDYPLLNYQGDTISIGQTKGWILIDMFQYGCRPCAEYHKKLHDESKDDGLCQLEEKGVSVMCIHPKTGLSDSFKQYVEKFGLQRRACCARELAPLIANLHSYPKYYLISPDKKIILEDEDDTSIILQTIDEYEKKH